MKTGLRDTWRKYLKPMEQLTWDLMYGATSDCTSLTFHHVPRPPGKRTLSVGVTNVRYATFMEYNTQPLPIPKTVHVLHEPVLVHPQSGYVMEPMRGFDPSIASSQQTYGYGHLVERFRERALHAGLVAASCEETAGEPRPRIPIPNELSGDARERGITMPDLGERTSQDYRTFHHTHVPYIVWDRGNGIMDLLSYAEAPVCAQGKKGKYVSMPVAGTIQRSVISDYRERFAQIPLKPQKEMRVRPPPGMSWRMATPAAFDDSRENDRHIANNNGCIVIEGDHIWESSNAFMKMNDPLHLHDNRNESSALAHRW